MAIIRGNNYHQLADRRLASCAPTCYENVYYMFADHDVMKYKEVVAALCDLGLEENQIYSIWEVGTHYFN